MEKNQTKAHSKEIIIIIIIITLYYIWGTVKIEDLLPLRMLLSKVRIVLIEVTVLFFMPEHKDTDFRAEFLGITTEIATIPLTSAIIKPLS